MNMKFRLDDALPVGVQARQEAERSAIAAVKRRARVPDACGPEIPDAPARGPMMRVSPREMVRTDAGNYRERPAGYLGRDAARVADAFDLMTLQAQRAHAKKGDDAGPFVPIFSSGQINAGRDYSVLAERCASSGIKCSSLEAIGGGSGSSCGREEAMLADFQRLRWMHARIGQGLAQEIRRIRPSSDGSQGRRPIYVRRLVDMVCIGGVSIDGVLSAHGWSRYQKTRQGLRASLCAALDRMQGV